MVSPKRNVRQANARGGVTMRGFLLALGVAVLLSNEWRTAAGEKSPQHLTEARRLVKVLKLEKNEYDHNTKNDPRRLKIVWEGDVRAVSDCSFLASELLKRSYGYT